MSGFWTAAAATGEFAVIVLGAHEWTVSVVDQGGQTTCLEVAVQ